MTNHVGSGIRITYNNAIQPVTKHIKYIKYYQNKIWSNASVLYEEHFYHVFGSMLETGI